MRYNLVAGIPDFWVFSFGGPFFLNIAYTITNLPTYVHFQKMTPPHVEATMMAFSTTIVNMSYGFVGSFSGYIINKYFLQITKENLHDKYYLIPIVLIVA